LKSKRFLFLLTVCRESGCLGNQVVPRSGLYPFIDYVAGGSIDGMINAMTANISMSGDRTIVIPGHGMHQRAGAIDGDREPSGRGHAHQRPHGETEAVMVAVIKRKIRVILADGRPVVRDGLAATRDCPVWRNCGATGFVSGVDPLVPVATGRFRHTKLWRVALGYDFGVIGD
jgi:hypothetical protein